MGTRRGLSDVTALSIRMQGRDHYYSCFCDVTPFAAMYLPLSNPNTSEAPLVFNGTIITSLKKFETCFLSAVIIFERSQTHLGTKLFVNKCHVISVLSLC